MRLTARRRAKKATRSLRVVQLNAHAGAAINTHLKQTLDHLAVDLVLLQEVSDDAYKRLLRDFGDTWHIVPSGGRHTRGRWATQTPILARKTRFKVLSQGNPLISRWLGGGKYGALHPTRYRTTARLLDLKTGATIAVGSIHTWVAGKASWNREQVKQLLAYATWAARRARSDVTLVGGDFNQDFNRRMPASRDARVILGKVGLKRAGATLGYVRRSTDVGGTAWLDDLFYRGATPIRQVLIKMGSDHLAVFTVVMVPIVSAGAIHRP